MPAYLKLHHWFPPLQLQHKLLTGCCVSIRPINVFEGHCSVIMVIFYNICMGDNIIFLLGQWSAWSSRQIAYTAEPVEMRPCIYLQRPFETHHWMLASTSVSCQQATYSILVILTCDMMRLNLTFELRSSPFFPQVWHHM